MRRPRYWAMLAGGIVLNVVVFLLPLTPYPVIQKIFDRDYFEVRRGYEGFLDTGKWAVGDPGFERARARYMTDVIRGWRPELDSTVMHGLRLDSFRLGESTDAAAIPEKRPVYVIYSNQQGHVVDGQEIKVMTATFREPYANLVSLALIAAAGTLVFVGLKGLLDSRINHWNQQSSGPAKDSLSRNTAT